MAHPGAADAIVAISVAAHGIRPERQPQARADWAHLWSRARGTETRVVLVQLTGDPYDPDPGWRRDTAIGSSARPVSIFLPPEPTGHVGVYEPAFDEALGAAVLRATGD